MANLVESMEDQYAGGSMPPTLEDTNSEDALNAALVAEIGTDGEASSASTQKRQSSSAFRSGVGKDGGGGVVCSGQSSPGRSSHSLSNSSARTATSNGSLPRRSFSRECYNSSPDPDEESNQEDDLEQLIRLHSEDFARPSIGVQTDYDDNFPPLKFLRSIGEDNNLAAMPMMFNMSEQQQLHHLRQQSPMVSIVPSSTSSSDLTASATCSNSADGTLQLVIQNFRLMADTVRGPSKFVQCVPWRIMVMPRQHVVQKKGTQKCLGFFLQCCPDAYSESWSCQAAAELRLISQKPGVPNFTRKTNHVYTAKENDWGYSCFMTWADILDEAQGYIKDDKVVLEVSVKADPPKNILSHKEFQKKIQEYKRLADMQCQRGLIDKAIEVNAQALKFCKDKDTECKTQLETQKAHLIEMKLKQSIERIEKGNDPNKPSEDDSAANLNALRHALGTNAARAASVKNTTTQKGNKTSSKEASDNTLAKMPADTTTPPIVPPTDDRSTTPIFPPAHLETTLLNGVLPTFDTKQKSTIINNNMLRKKKSSKGNPTSLGCSAGEQCKSHLNSKGRLNSKELVALGHFNKSLLNSDEFDFVKERYEDEEELLPEQIQHYLQHLSEKDKESSRLKRFSAELEMLASPLEIGKRADDTYLNELLSLPPREADALTLAALNCEMEEQKIYLNNRKTYRKNLCDSCLKEERDVKSSAERVPPPTSESGCQTEFSRCLSREVLATDAAARLMQLQQQQQQQLQQANDLVNNIAPPALPARHRKKATAKKTMQQQQQQQQPKANPRNARLNSGIAGVGLQENMLPAMGLLNAMDKKTLLSGNLDNHLANLTAELEVGKMQSEDMMAAQPTANSIFSRQYIEEWLRYSARNVLKLNYDNNGKPFITTRSGSDVAEICSENDLREPEISEVTTALGVIGLNCMNARNIQQKVAEFVQTLQSHTNFRDMRASIDRLLSLCSDYENCADDSISVVSISESSTKDTDMSKDFADFASFPRTFAEEDPHDYMLSRELKQAEMVLAGKLNSIIYQLHQASLPDIVERIERRIETIKGNEAQANKQFLEVQKTLQAANERYEKLNQQHKEKKNEIKKLEKKAKSEAQLSAENSELHDKVDAFKKEVSHLQRQINEEQMKYKRDTQSLADSKKHLHVELSSRSTEIQKLSNQLEEKAQALKKSESQLANERKSNSSTIASLTERVKKAEMSLLEHKLEDGLKVLERARDDCVMQIRSLEEQQKRHIFPAEQEVIRKNIAEWENKREEVCGLISQAKADFTTHINSIKGGKQLSQLPKLQVPRPPPCPKLHPMPLPPPVVPPPPVIASSTARTASPSTSTPNVVVPPSPLPLERKAITPPSSTRSRMGGATTPQHLAGLSMNATMQSPSGSGVVTYTSSIPNSSNATPVKNFQLHQQPPPNLPPVNVTNANPIAPIGVRPYNYQNGVSQPKAPTPMMHLHQARQSPTGLSTQYTNMMHQQQMPVQQMQQQQQYMQHQQQQQVQKSQPQQQQQQATGGSFQTWGGWGDQFNNISELFCQGRSFGPLGSDFGNSAARSNGSTGANPNAPANNKNNNGSFFS